MDERDHVRAKAAELRQYEGSTDPFRPIAGDPPMHLHAPFGPMIGRSRFPACLIDRLNQYGDRIVAAFGGGEFILDEDTVLEGGAQSLLARTEDMVARYVQAVRGAAASEVRIDLFWMVSQSANSPSPVHFHSSDISGVFYLRVPEVAAQEEERSYISGRRAGYINFLTGGRQEYARSLASYRPAVGDLYVFPGWLLHGAEPFVGTGERRSIAFNATVVVD
jgi:hypothetical protein